MIGVGVPWILGAAVFAALATCVLHFISVRRPPVMMLPTMRFLPDRPVRAVSRSARPSDLLLLLLRVMALLLAGAALSGLYWRAAGVKHGRVVVIQREPDANIETVRNAAARALSGAFALDTSTRVVVMDTTAHLLNVAESKAFRPETLSNLAWGGAAVTPTFSAAVLAATRAASLLVSEERNVDAVDLVIVAPLVREWRDAAVTTVRAAWPGVIRFNTSRDAADSAGRIAEQRTSSVALAGTKASDAVQSAFEVRGWTKPSVAIASVATGAIANAADAALAAPIAIEWPASGVPEGWTSSKPAVVGAVVARGEALVFPFQRTAQIPDALAARGRALAWWSDGEVAAVEIPTATSCTRRVGIHVPASSDVLQGQAARALLLALTGPCGGERDTRALTFDDLLGLAGKGSAAPASAFRSAAVGRTPWAPLLLVLAIALLIAEWFVRDREDRMDAVIDPKACNVPKAA